jgi:hypothetical protein
VRIGGAFIFGGKAISLPSDVQAVFINTLLWYLTSSGIPFHLLGFELGQETRSMGLQTLRTERVSCALDGGEICHSIHLYLFCEP